MSCTFVDSGEDAHPKALIGLQAGLSLDVQARDAEASARRQLDIDSAAAMRGKQQGAVFAAIDGNGDIFFHSEGLSIEQGIEPMEHQGAQGEADDHGGENVADHAVASLNAALQLSCWL
jgi:hypothetical protein